VGVRAGGVCAHAVILPRVGVPPASRRSVNRRFHLRRDSNERPPDKFLPLARIWRTQSIQSVHAMLASRFLSDENGSCAWETGRDSFRFYLSINKLLVHFERRLRMLTPDMLRDFPNVERREQTDDVHEPMGGALPGW
jgi:hypothetical protein